MGPSKDLGIMDLYEAKATPLTQFTNNVAHSNVHVRFIYIYITLDQHLCRYHPIEIIIYLYGRFILFEILEEKLYK